ncbi:hypothetical protein EAT1b_0540 [Exiguobacterium sp. AT1b]|uniref:Prepilin-type N-terminal cleavage/methylation domain-containing protein n=1 Tax=Exiguobacterium sp. (strain ATCC BAA-1283 / AT1b) TaxID=360911 RepID=C4L3H4_EXISA|nr:hypothetical protein [Exiguobacterium sp. AT1b]ACQ69472.1 hypothetical protein EAT1b_0540 [Exiguobacterium sp. AT1b]
MKVDESGFSLWELTVSLAVIMGWMASFVVQGNERIQRLSDTLFIYERLQGEVLLEATEPTGREQVCEKGFCLPTL